MNSVQCGTMNNAKLKRSTLIGSKSRRIVDSARETPEEKQESKWRRKPHHSGESENLQRWSEQKAPHSVFRFRFLRFKQGNGSHNNKRRDTTSRPHHLKRHRKSAIWRRLLRSCHCQPSRRILLTTVDRILRSIPKSHYLTSPSYLCLNERRQETEVDYFSCSVSDVAFKLKTGTFPLLTKVDVKVSHRVPWRKHLRHVSICR